MNNPFQEQLLKAGLVTKKQVQKAKQDINRKNRQQRATREKAIDEAQLKVQQAAEEKAQHDRELNRKRQEQAQQKAISIEINQLINKHRLARDESCEIAYNFEHKGKIRRIYVNHEMQQKIMQGKLGIARIEGGYELVPSNIAEKIQQRNEKRVVIFSKDQQPDHAADIAETDPYSDYNIPDDLMW
ncbi:MAG: DUF2058 domain-containing protein [Gammaproteobacteria bacterium]|nr:DUF2058 domain-containing protein [Gammaproteobacteria bacterium]